MFTLISFIQIEQCTKLYPSNLIDPETGQPPINPETEKPFQGDIPRNKIFYFTLFEEIEISKSVDQIIQTAKIKLPRRFTGNQFKVFNSDANRGVNLSDNKVVVSIDTEATYTPVIKQYYHTNRNDFVENVDSTSSLDNFGISSDNLLNIEPPLFYRGDQITIYLGYLIDNEILDSNFPNPIQLHQHYKGYISSVSAGEIIELLCEDEMFYLKQLRIPNKSYNPDPNLNNNNLNYTNPITYNGLDSTIVSNNDKIYELKIVPTTTGNGGNPLQYSIKNLQGVLFDCLNNTYNDANIIANGIFPLAWKYCDSKINGNIQPNQVPKPAIVLANQAIRSAGIINIQNNASIFDLLNTIKEDFNMNVYFNQQSAAYNFAIFYENNVNDGKYIPLPVHDLWGNPSNCGYPGNYLNLGYDQYLPFSIYSPIVWNFTLTGSNCNVISNNLNWKKKEDFIMGAIIKSKQMGPTNDNDELVTTTLLNLSKKNIRSSSVIIGELGGSLVTYYYSHYLKMTNGVIISPQENDYLVPDPDPKNAGETLYDIATFGYNKLNEIHYTGFYGSITTIGIPFVNIGDIVNIIDPAYPERNGLYRIKKVSIKANKEIGLQQEISLNYQVISGTDSNGNITYNTPNISNNKNVYYNNKTYKLQ